MNSTVIKKEGVKAWNPDFTTVTEMPGALASAEQLSMLYTRYHFAASFCQGKEVLEVGCGAGQGLGYLARFAKKVVGIDIDEENLKTATLHYYGRENIKLQCRDAHEMAFEDETFDVVILFEAIYYLNRPDLFLAECRRVLRERGVLLINTVNPEWQDFNPSPFSTHYFPARELAALLESYGFKVDFYGAFPAQGFSMKSKMTSILKRSARNLGLIPRTMKGKEFLKRIFFGRLAPIPSEVDEGMAEYMRPTSLLSDVPVPQYKVLYAVGQKNGEI
jgi:2-polyprenyl-3-methyl-5-hydroxy-6-metoxy-1,4-benzoquinol methylase